MSQPSHSVVRSGLLLGLIALTGTALLTGVNALTHERIQQQEKNRMMQQLNAIVPATSFNNDLLADRIDVREESLSRNAQAVPVYRARLDGRPVAALMTVTAPDGYNGDIRILVGMDYEGTVLGVRIVSHRETPGLGDPIELDKSDWILSFTSKSLQNPGLKGWAVKRDGGAFDQFTGATISPRAVVRAVHNCLLYFKANRQDLFDTPAGTTELNG